MKIVLSFIQFTIIPFDFLMTTILSFVFYLLISGPFANLVNNFLTPRKILPESNSKNNKSHETIMEKIVCENNGFITFNSNK